MGRETIKAEETWKDSLYEGVERLNNEGMAVGTCLDEECGKKFYRLKAGAAAAKHTLETGHETHVTYTANYTYRAAEAVESKDDDTEEESGTEGIRSYPMDSEE